MFQTKIICFADSKILFLLKIPAKSSNFHFQINFLIEILSEIMSLNLNCHEKWITQNEKFAISRNSL